MRGTMGGIHSSSPRGTYNPVRVYVKADTPAKQNETIAQYKHQPTAVGNNRGETIHLERGGWEQRVL